MKNSPKKRILLITPMGSRTGSEMMLWSIMHHLDPDKFEVAVACYARGELLTELPPHVRSFYVPGTFTTIDRVRYHLGMNPIVSALKRIQKEFQADVWYLNTIVLPMAAATADSLGIPFVVHFHEMPLSYVYVNREEFRRMVQHAKLVIGCSEPTCEGIRQAGGQNVELLYSFIDESMIPADPVKIAALRKQMDIGEGDFVWIMSGVPSERKGFDFFPDLSEKLNRKNVHLVWVGGTNTADGYLEWVENRIKSSDSLTKIHLVGRQKENYAQYLHMADGFLLTSRQDPFPLVMLEAASLGKPIVAFPSGGVSEFLVDGMGAVTADISVGQMVAEMNRVMDGELVCDPELSRKRVGDFNIQNGVSRWQQLMESIV